LDRVDQHALPLDDHYFDDDTAGEGVRVYILGGWMDVDQPDFAGRAANGPSFVNDGNPDCTDPGTGLGGLVGGTEFGVAKKARLVAVRIMDCHNIFTTAAAVSGFTWVTENAPDPSVLLFAAEDYCVDTNTGQAVDCPADTARTLVNLQEGAFAAGLPVVGMAGDSSQDACAKSSGAAPNAIYIGSTGRNDSLASFSNFGPCVSMYAPGVDITTDASAGTQVANTSAASAAYAAATLALFMGMPEFAGASPGEVRDELVRNRSTNGVITGLGGGSNNRLLFTGPPGMFSIGDSTALAPTGNGRLELLGANKDAWLFHSEQTGATSWSGWAQSATKGWLSVAAGANADGRVELAGLTPTGDIWIRAEAAVNTNTWYTWSRLDRPAPATSPMVRAAMAHNHSNRLEVFATNQQGQVFYRSQTSPGSRTWGAWAQFSFSGHLRSITAVANDDGRIELLGTDDAGQVWHAAQTSATDNDWSTFTKLGDFGVASIAAARNDNGNLELVGVDTGGGAWHRTQTSRGSTAWSNWAPLPRNTIADITADTDSNGRVQLVGVDNLGNIWQTRQTTPNSTNYQGWTQISGQLRP
jgi:hypothetical protein